MKRTGLFILAALLGYSGYETGRTDDTEEVIEWTDNARLQWSDFHGIPDEKSRFHALTSAEILFSSSTYADSAILDIRCLFVKDSSWTKSTHSIPLLKHEQLHFDLAELTARRLRKACAQLHPSSPQDAARKFQITYNNYAGASWQELNDAYDSQTGHGIIAVTQQQWEVRTARDLKMLDRYASPKVVLRY